MPRISVWSMATLTLACLPAAAAPKERLKAAFANGHYQGHLIESDGTLWGWGDNDHGELCVDPGGGPTFLTAPIQVGGTDIWYDVKGGEDFQLILKDNGTLWACGHNGEGELGSGLPTGNDSPAMTLMRQVWLDGVVAISAGERFGVAIRYDGSLWSWGSNDRGQLGLGTADPERNSPYQVLHTPGSPSSSDYQWKAVAAGYSHVVALKADGTLWAWGSNNKGELGINNWDDQNVPRAVTTSFKWRAMAAANQFTLAIRSDGALYTWGKDSYGQLGDGGPFNTDDKKNLPGAVTSAGGDWVAVAGGDRNSIGLKANGRVYSWGSDVGDGTSIGQSAPKLNLSLSQVVGISAGYIVSFAMKGNGALYTWGDGPQGEEGRQGDLTLPGIAVGTGGRQGLLEGGQSHSGMIRGDGSLWTFGQGANGRLGLGSNYGDRLSAELVSSSHGWQHFEGGITHSLALRADGTLWSAGYNQYGQMGRGSVGGTGTGYHTFGIIRHAANATPFDSTWKQVSAGGTHSHAIKGNGTLWSWGRNNNRQLGINSTVGTQNVATQIASTSPSSASNDWIWVSAGNNHGAAIKADGSLWLWGLNDNGQLGANYPATQIRPVKLTSPNKKWVAVECGDGHTVALAVDGTLWSWGKNGSGQVATGNFTTPRTTPFEQGSASWSQISVSSTGNHTLAVDGWMGEVYGWGYNQYGQIGDGTSTNRNSPTYLMVSDLTTMYGGSLGTGGNHSLNIFGGWGLSWGRNGNGQLGHGTTFNAHRASYFQGF